MLQSFKYAINGIVKAFVSQRNMQIHGVALIVAVFAGWYFKISNLEWIAILLCSSMVFGAEIFNTAIEEIVNFISPNQHPKAGLIKDLSAGAVLVSAIFAVVVAVIIFLPKIF